MREYTHKYNEEDAFYSPFNEQLLIKAEEGKDGQRIIFIEASNENIDVENEITFRKALEREKDSFLREGILSWDHKSKQLYNPLYQIGEPLDIKFTDDNKTLVKGFLYTENKIASAVWDNLRSGTKRIGASVGGYVLKKSTRPDGVNEIQRVVFDEVALTNNPVNISTLGNVKLIPFSEFAKSLMAGSGVDANTFLGGRAITPESMQGTTVNILPELQGLLPMVAPATIENVIKGFFEKIMTGSLNTYNDLASYISTYNLPMSVALQIIGYICRNISKIGEQITY